LKKRRCAITYPNNRDANFFAHFDSDVPRAAARSPYCRISAAGWGRHP
jgi:hypothetical protein